MSADLGPFDIAPVVARLKAQVTALRAVQGAAEFAAAVKATTAPPTPSAYVLLARENGPAAQPASEIAIQRHDVRFGVVLAVRNYQLAQLGTAQADSLTALINSTRTTLVGWKPTGFTGQRIEWNSGSVLSYDAATVWWQEIFTTRYWSRT